MKIVLRKCEKQAQPGALHGAGLKGFCCGAARCGLVLRSALRLYVLGHKAAVIAHPALDKSLRIIFEGIRQRISAHVADREPLPFALQHKINSPGIAMNASRLNGAAHTNPLSAAGAVQRLQFRDGVVVGLALAIAQPRQRRQRSDNHGYSNSKSCASLHKTPLPQSVRTVSPLPSTFSSINPLHVERKLNGLAEAAGGWALRNCIGKNFRNVTVLRATKPALYLHFSKLLTGSWSSQLMLSDHNLMSNQPAVASLPSLFHRLSSNNAFSCYKFACVIFITNGVNHPGRPK